MPHLLAISIGPVQEFIAAGRKTRDLWFGSMLLSAVSHAAAKELQGINGVDLIFPAPIALGSQASIANKILAVVNQGTPKDLVDRARNAAKGPLKQDLEDIRKLGLPNIDWPLVEAQVEDFLEFYAAWVPHDPASYQQDRVAVERLLAGRKAFRGFKVAHGRPGRLKSSLDPSRESVILPSSGAPGDEAARREAKQVRAQLKLKAGEQLDGISLIKRHAEPRRFVSISRIAIDPFIRRIKSDPSADPGLVKLTELAGKLTASPAVESFEGKLGNGLVQYQAFPFDTQLFYDDGSHDTELTDAGHIQDAKAFYKQVHELKCQLSIPELPTYLAVLVADGDKMGEAIRALATPERHVGLSEALVGFAKAADEIVAAHQGALVYSGGDDVLAFLPLDRALACADSLRKRFEEIVQPALEQFAPGAADKIRVSLSVGIAIGHYGEHLQNLLAWAHKAEQEAKRERNSLAVALHTRAGGEMTAMVSHSWSDDPIQRWQRWINWHQRDLIPDGAVYELGRLAREFQPEWEADAERERLREVIEGEVNRILGRKRPGHGMEDFDTARQQVIRDHVADGLPTLQTVVNELIIARRFAAAYDVAGGPVGSEEDGNNG